MNSSVANRIRYGTSLSKIAGGVQRNSSAPAIPPTRLGTIRMRNRGSAARHSRRAPQAPPRVPRPTATVLVAFAVTEPRPSQISAGKETSVPPPATELMAPARKAAPKATAACVRSKYAILTRSRRSRSWLLTCKRPGMTTAATAPEDLAALRHQKGISLHQIAEATKIGVRYLEAIESGQFDKLPGGFYNVSYIRQYARAIEINEGELLERYLQFASIS